MCARYSVVLPTRMARCLPDLMSMSMNVVRYGTHSHCVGGSGLAAAAELLGRRTIRSLCCGALAAAAAACLCLAVCDETQTLALLRALTHTHTIEPRHTSRVIVH